jgi:hypothetical protein
MIFLNNYMEWINSTSESDFFSNITASPDILQWVAPFLNAPYNYWESLNGLDHFSFTFSKYSIDPEVDPTPTIQEMFQILHYRVNICTEGLNGSCHYYLRPICPAAPSKYLVALHRMVLSIRIYIDNYIEGTYSSLKSTSQMHNIKYIIPNIESKKKNHAQKGYYTDLIKKINTEMSNYNSMNMFNTTKFADPLEPEHDIINPLWSNIPTDEDEEECSDN